MKIKSVLKFISDGLFSIFAITTFVSLVVVSGAVAITLLAMLGHLIGIDMDIFIHLAMFFIFWKAWDALAWIVGKIADRIKRKKEREYFERLNKTE